MDTRVCKVCGVEKPFVKGSWVSVHGVAEGKTCLSCHALNNKHQHAKRYVNQEIRKKEQARCRETKRIARLQTSLKLKMLQATNTWYYNNKAKAISLAINRRIAKMHRTPRWLIYEDLALIEAKYSIAKWLSEVVGVAYHVDHIIPLQGRLVSGLHVPLNLQVIHATKNLSKGNKYANF